MKDKLKLTEKGTRKALDKWGFKMILSNMDTAKEDGHYIFQYGYVPESSNWALFVEDDNSLTVDVDAENKVSMEEINKLLKKLKQYKYIDNFEELELVEVNK